MGAAPRVALSWDLDDAFNVIELFESASRLAFGRVDRGWAADAQSLREQVAAHEANAKEREDEDRPGLWIVAVPR